MNMLLDLALTPLRTTLFGVALVSFASIGGIGGVAGCGPARAPTTASRPYAVRLVGASDNALHGVVRDGRSAFVGRVGRDYAIEITNDTPSPVAVAIVIDGLDGRTGEPVDSCETTNAGWVVSAESRVFVRGFSVSETSITTYRFAPRERSLAAITRGGRRDRIGTIDVCFFSTQPSPRSAEDRARPSPTRFEGVVEEPTATTTTPNAPGTSSSSSAAASEPRIVGEIREERWNGYADVQQDKLITRILVTYEDEEGRPLLGTAPPRPGIATVDRGIPDAPNDEDGDDVKGGGRSSTTRGGKPPKPSKETKQEAKETKPSKPKGATKGEAPKGAAPLPGKPEKSEKGEK